ncbi:hypothetical protein [Methylomicrobium sp. Wu6]|uniref:hypothetical protein n=1 Tax=Methylomicrobium sp. Wu6 TaxID=3107928 RepID=UPI002DD6A306|nr:hypothetical protein [Methylomicrobium sp. Wu6]MEC4748038.1 hypothetical protein [Methylomicrobium sp. Wu6]
MKRYNAILINNIPAHPETLRKQTAIHEAGHAAAIYLGNKQKQLPPVFFQIIIKDMMHDTQWPRQTRHSISHAMACFAKVEGGRLIHTLPSSLTEATRRFSPLERQAYQSAFEADIVNFLAGPLAEAKYIALCDNEIFNPRLVNLDALHFYGGVADVALAKEYLDCLIVGPQEKERLIAELFMAAYRFISQRSHWRAITALAEFILSSGKKVIECEEIIRVLEAQAV